MGKEDRMEWRRMIAVQVPMMRWARSQGLIALLEEIRALEKLTTPLVAQGQGWPTILPIGRCTNLSLSANGRSLLLYLERAGVGANRRTEPPQNQPVRSNHSHSHSTRQV